jgi:hypothetical protein
LKTETFIIAKEKLLVNTKRKKMYRGEEIGK